MPYVHVTSNIASSSVDTASVAKAIAQRSAKLLGMPDDSNLMSQLSLDTTTCFAGSDEPAAFVSVHSIFEWDAEKNKQLSLEFTELVSKQLKVPSTRVFIHFVMVKPSNWGSRSTTVAVLLGLE